MLAWLLSWLTPFNVIVYTAMTAAPYIAFFKVNGKAVGTPELNAKYWPFAR